MRPILPTLAVLLIASTPAWAGPPPETPPGLRENVNLVQVPERLELPALDVARLRAEDSKRRARGEPPRYAVPVKLDTVTPDTHGSWDTLADGNRVWRYRILAKGATSVEPAFTRFRLPVGAALYVHGNDGKRVRGPYTHADNRRHGELWVPIVEGDRATIELVLEPGVRREAVGLELTEVLQGYDEFWKANPLEKATNTCNVDVECPQADDWEDPIASVARITIGGGRCTGQMINDTAFSGRPLFLTANHCGLRESNAASLQVYWNYRNSTCRDITNSPGTTPPGDGSLDDVQSGSTFLSRFVSSDFTLVELDRQPEDEWDVYWTGWDRRDRTFNFAAGIHHPAGDEKRISFEQDTLDIIDGDQLNSGGPNLLTDSEALPDSHLRVNDWDLGVTEQGSSGSGLWNGQKRLVGQLHGGGVHQCDNNDFDWYGRFWMSWEGGGTAATSLKPWLDPLGTGTEVMDGRDGDCNAPSVNIADNVDGPTAGELFTLSAGGGNSNVDFFWDVDGDGIADAQGRNVQVRFTGAGARDVKLIATNAANQCGTTVTKTMTVKAPDAQLAGVGQPRELSGDGDDDMEPGERWDIPVTLSNQGTARANSPTAIFTRIAGTNGDSLGPDGFGYTGTDSRGSGCPFQWVNIAGQNNRVTFNPVSVDFSGDDDGGSDPIPVSNFPFYNRSVSAIVMSSNGYLAPSASRNGGDFTNDCPLPTPVDRDPSSFPATGHARLAPYHDDLVTGLAWELRQNPCERPGDAPGGNGACRIFQWNGVSTFSDASLEFDFQAILYEGTGQIVYQYGPNAPAASTTPTVGIQDQSASNGLTWGCASSDGEQPPLRPDASSAVCFFHPQAQPPQFDADAVNLETPALDFADIPAGGNRTTRLVFEIDPEAECGADFGISLHGTIFEGGFSAGPGTIFTDRVGGENAVCDANVRASAAKASIDFQPGMYYNPARDGHGADIHLGGGNAFLVWYTYGPDRQPIWYLAVGEYVGDQIVADLLKFTGGDVDNPETVGKVIVTFVNETSAYFSWTLNGVAGGEPFEVLAGQPPALDPNRTGHWFPPSQDGWGLTFNQQGQTEFDIVYFYDSAGQPVWALGVKENAAGGDVDLDQFKGVCPGCDWTPVSFQATGELMREFSSATAGSVETDISLQAPLDGTWSRGPVAIEILSDPVQ